MPEHMTGPTCQALALLTVHTRTLPCQCCTAHRSTNRNAFFTYLGTGDARVLEVIIVKFSSAEHRDGVRPVHRCGWAANFKRGREEERKEEEAEAGGMGG